MFITDSSISSLHQGGYVFAFVGLSVSRMTKKVVDNSGKISGGVRGATKNKRLDIGGDQDHVQTQDF